MTKLLIVLAVLAGVVAALLRFEPWLTPRDRLVRAVETGDAPGVAHWLTHGAQVKGGGNPGADPLLRMAAGSGSAEICRLLLDGGADLAAVGPSMGETALGAAAEHGHLEVARLLLERGADPLRAETYLGWTPLHAAVARRAGAAAELVRLLVAKGPAALGARDKEGNTPLALAATYPYGAGSELPMVDLLLSLGADPDDWRALKTLKDEVLEHLLDAGADVDTRSPDGSTTPLHGYAADGALTRVRLLLARGASPDLAVKDGTRPLHLALASRRAEVARELVERGADPDAPDPKGRRPLELAIEGGMGDVVELLLEKGADPALCPALAAALPAAGALEAGGSTTGPADPRGGLMALAAERKAAILEAVRDGKMRKAASENAVKARARAAAERTAKKAAAEKKRQEFWRRP